MISATIRFLCNKFSSFGIMTRRVAASSLIKLSAHYLPLWLNNLCAAVNKCSSGSYQMENLAYYCWKRTSQQPFVKTSSKDRKVALVIAVYIDPSADPPTASIKYIFYDVTGLQKKLADASSWPSVLTWGPWTECLQNDAYQKDVGAGPSPDVLVI